MLTAQDSTLNAVESIELARPVLQQVSCYICVLILLNMCPHTTLHVPAYCCVCVLMLLHVSGQRRTAAEVV
jgi:hypothetical protein